VPIGVRTFLEKNSNDISRFGASVYAFRQPRTARPSRLEKRHMARLLQNGNALATQRGFPTQRCLVKQRGGVCEGTRHVFVRGELVI
jgi:hypothetical protein